MAEWSQDSLWIKELDDVHIEHLLRCASNHQPLSAEELIEQIEGKDANSCGVGMDAPVASNEEWNTWIANLPG